MQTRKNSITLGNGKKIEGENIEINMSNCFSVPDNIDLVVLNNLLKYKAPWECSLRKIRESKRANGFKKYVNPNLLNKITYEYIYKSKEYAFGIHRQLTGYELQKCAALYKDLDEGKILIIDSKQYEPVLTIKVRKR